MLRKLFIKDKNSSSLDYASNSRSSKMKKYIYRPIQVIVLAVILSVAYSFFFDTAEEYKLKQENAQLLNNLALIQLDLDSLNANLALMQEKDDHIYRQLLGVDPLAEEIRTAGIGGRVEDETTTALPSDFELGKYRKEINQLNAKLKVQSVSFDELTTIASDNIIRMEHRPSIYPIAPKDLIRLSSRFGYRTHPIFKIRKFHKGIDLSALKGSPIYSTAKGKVIIANNFQDGYGNKVVIDHGYGYKTVYAHLNKIEVKVGQQMDLGDLIGEVGSTGISVAPHLHYEVRFNDTVINPLDFIFKDISSEEYQLITQR